MAALTKRVCVIGAGPCGIAAAKNCLLAGLDVVVFEKSDSVGGNWAFSAEAGHSSVYENTYLISSKAWSEYEDYPMPDDYPDYPGHREVQAYFDDYARHFGVTPNIRFGHTVIAAAREPEGWRVAFADAAGATGVESFDALMVANGHHWKPRYPDFPGAFAGTTLHSHDFKRLDESWRGKNVLVVGAGNSACDVAVEAARLANKVCLSMRSPQWFFPKFVLGMPADVFAAMTPSWVPARIRQTSIKLLMRLLQGPYSRYGLPENTRLPLTDHPTMNSDLFDFIRHGRIKPRPAIRRLLGGEIEFADGTREAFDILCVATGYWISFPFFDSAFVDFSTAERVPLYRKMMHPRYADLYFIGLIQPLGCIWPLADYQARLACLEILGRYKRPLDMEHAIAREIAHPHFDYQGGPRHSIEVDYRRYRKELKNDLRGAGLDIGEPPAGRKGRYKTAAALTARPPAAIAHS
jgi:hypothetical protein